MPRRIRRLAAKLIAAIERCDLQAARAALDEGAHPNRAGESPMCPIFAAVQAGDDAVREALVDLLLARGADPHVADPRGRYEPPIFTAVSRCDEAVARRLLAAGGFPRDAAGRPARTRHGATLLASACNSGMRWLVERALAEGLRADDVFDRGRTALHHATTTGRFRLPDKDTAGLIALLLDHGAPIEQQQDCDGGSALHCAMRHGDPPAVRTLVARGARLEARTDRGTTPLQAGAMYSDGPTIAAAIDLGADTRVVAADGKTLLHLVAERAGAPETQAATVARLLLAAGLDPTAVDNAGHTPLSVAAMSFARSVKTQPEHRHDAAAQALLVVLRDAAPVELPRGVKLPVLPPAKKP